MRKSYPDDSRGVVRGNLTDWPCGHPMGASALVDMGNGKLMCPQCYPGSARGGLAGPIVLFVSVVIVLVLLSLSLPGRDQSGCPTGPRVTPTTYGYPPTGTVGR